ncbi:hypothetical protein F4809DRAFT_213105 [Biscogniauxia mediterranea]|nr:hypothetical protein F4809DRAFT_213105 [Biscogniauxia mediterranea]
MASEEHDTTTFHFTAGPSDGDDTDIEMDPVDESPIQVSPSSDRSDAITMLPEDEDLGQRIQSLESKVETYKQLADTYRFRLEKAWADHEMMTYRVDSLLRERSDLLAKLAYHEEDTTAIITQLRTPWYRFLQVYNDMRLPVDESLHEGSLEMLLAQVLDAKLQQVVAKAAQEQDNNANTHNDNNNAIMLQLPICELAGLSLGGGNHAENESGEKQTDVVEEKAQKLEIEGEEEQDGL